jgi:hypothetical protein
MSDLPDLAPATAAQRVVIPDGAIPPAAPRTPTGDILHGSALTFDVPDQLKRIGRRENKDQNPFLGYGGVDLSKAPLDKNGFPIWSGRMGPAGLSHAAGLYQIQPGTWGPIAGELGITDFSEGSQHRVAQELYRREGSAPWAASEGKGEAVVAGKRMLGSDDLPDLPAVGTASSAAPAGSAVPQSELMTSEDQIPTGGTQEYSRASAALLHGITRGMVEPALAVAQATLPREQMAPIEARLRQVESDYADLRDEHPTLEQIGRLTGATVTIGATARLFGAVAPVMLPAMAAKAAQAT